MSFKFILYTLKGSASSGNFGHAGRPGKRGGSAPGGGHGAIGIKPGDNALNIINNLRNAPANLRNAPADFKLYDELSDADVKLLYKASSGAYGKFANRPLYSLSKTEKSYLDALAAYKGVYYKGINQALRGQKPMTPTTQKKVDAIDKYMKGDDNTHPYGAYAVRTVAYSPSDQRKYGAYGYEVDLPKNSQQAPKDMLVYRAIGTSKSAKQLQFNPGDIFTDNGYSSTSLRKSGAETVSNIHTMMRINVPKGTKGLYMDGITTINDEYEYLLPRGSRFKVHNSTIGTDGIRYVDMELLND